MSRSKTKDPADVTQEDVAKLLSYDAATGILAWRVQWYRAKPGTSPTFNSNGYLKIGLFGHHHYVHRVIFLLVEGHWPIGVDHINGNKRDNRWANLRKADKSENGRNCRLRKDSISGLKGANKAKGTDAWDARITHRGKRYYLGRFYSPQDAHNAYVTAAQELFGEYASDGRRR